MGKQIVKVEKDVLSDLLEYDFPGNVRELKNMVDRAVLVAKSSVLRREHFVIPDPFGGSSELERIPTLEDMERHWIVRALEATGNNQVQAAKLLGVERRVVYRKMLKYGIK